jgi:hypothetical protein
MDMDMDGGCQMAGDAVGGLDSAMTLQVTLLRIDSIMISLIDRLY